MGGRDEGRKSGILGKIDIFLLRGRSKLTDSSRRSQITGMIGEMAETAFDIIGLRGRWKGRVSEWCGSVYCLTSHAGRQVRLLMHGRSSDRAIDTRVACRRRRRQEQVRIFPSHSRPSLLVGLATCCCCCSRALIAVLPGQRHAPLPPHCLFCRRLVMMS